MQHDNTHGSSDEDARISRDALGRLVRLCLKELREILRDRRTIVTLVLMPLLVYPLLSTIFHRLLFTSLQPASQSEWIIGVANEEEGFIVQRYLALGESLLQRKETQQRDTGSAAPARFPDLVIPDTKPHIRFVTASDLEQRVIDAAIDLAVVSRMDKPPSQHKSQLGVLRCELVYREHSALSKAVLEHVSACFREINDRHVQNQLAALGQRIELPTEAISRSVGGVQSAFSITTIIPLILILMTITGAVYPAIDLTAGERERGTLEALMAAPVPRLGLLAAKYVAVVTVALLTATVNLAAMTVTLLVSGLGTMLFGQSGLSLAVIAEVFGLLVLFAAFFSAILLAVTSFARSFKEAQAYLVPLMLLSLAPGVMSLMPGVEFNALFAVIPLLNVVLLARDVLAGGADPALAVVAVLSTGLYAFAAVALAARIFGTDAILYGSQASWSDFLRAQGRVREVPSMAAAMACLAVLFPCCFLTASALARIAGIPMALRLGLNGLATLLLFAGLPFVAARFQGLRVARTFSIRMPRLLSLIAAIALGLSVWPLAHEIFLVNRWIGVVSLGEQQLESVRRLLQSWSDIHPTVIIFSLAIAPAVGEEFFFRGYLFSALRRAMPAWATIVCSALLFGAFHVVTTSMLAAERFLPSTFLGLILGWVCYRTGSILPGMLLHACHNGFLLMVAYYRDSIINLGWGANELTHMPPTWIAASVITIAIAVWLLAVANKREARETETRSTTV